MFSVLFGEKRWMAHRRSRAGLPQDQPAPVSPHQDDQDATRRENGGSWSEVARAPSGGFFFVWTMIALGVTALFSIILAARGLWDPQWGQSK
jgi:hypothetical protein